ncbi:uncharacterized protein LOC130904094 isoform X1 [Diorhabda carinulata]|uniref:uncharacterized protein LOC130904094 isoform X1 n=1 Tax=Diorhabda carinulata TaxID=1163345 RepID=UPI0025A0C5CB|nr:uncharacterized protein LOC130904094 isoform X1 [Diorhabda carinulata]
MATRLNLTKILLVVLVLLLSISLEVEARRKILRGRKTINRSYMRESAVPPFVVVILVAIGEIIFGGILYVIFKFCILDKPISPRYQMAPREEP